jgi:hypothetical protein
VEPTGDQTKVTTCDVTMKPLRQRTGVLYSALVIAAIVVIIFSVIGIAIMADVMPGMQSPEEPVTKSMRR